MAANKKQRTMTKKKPHPRRGKVSFRPGTLTISYDHPAQILPTLLDLSSHFAEQHIDSPKGITDSVLGSARAQAIVSGCARSTCWSCTLSDAQVSPSVFQTCVFNGVKQAGFTASLDQIPATSDTQLVDVVTAIQSAPAGG
jgi:hypothetical protein